MISSFTLSNLNDREFSFIEKACAGSDNLTVRLDQEIFPTFSEMHKEIRHDLDYMEHYYSTNLFGAHSSLYAHLEDILKPLIDIAKNDANEILMLKEEPVQAFQTTVKPILSSLLSEMITSGNTVKKTMYIYVKAGFHMGSSYITNVQMMAEFENSSLSILQSVHRILLYSNASQANIAAQAKALFKPTFLIHWVPRYLIYDEKQRDICEDYFTAALKRLICHARAFLTITANSSNGYYEDMFEFMSEVNCTELSGSSEALFLMENNREYEDLVEKLTECLSEYERFLETKGLQQRLTELSSKLSQNELFKSLNPFEKVKDIREQNGVFASALLTNQYNSDTRMQPNDYFGINTAINNISQFIAGDLKDHIDEMFQSLNSFSEEIFPVIRACYMDVLHQASTLEDYFPEMSENVTSKVRRFALWKKPVGQRWSQDPIKSMLEEDEAMDTVSSSVAAFHSTRAWDVINERLNFFFDYFWSQAEQRNVVTEGLLQKYRLRLQELEKMEIESRYTNERSAR